MEIEKVFNLIIVAITVIYIAVIFNFLMKIEKQDVTKQLNIQLNSEDLQNKKEANLHNSRVKV
ncbi:hypothetical protein REISMN_01155 [Rickettsia tamurae subsp. buchneri]|uniref:Uncharacterized protein n=1 Tax=Rickettsia tamurae subsp. buchneri TaxID=1462938 RepID=A0A8E0WMW1_9RICK|nr:hypothetical protein REIS_1817 [Rickettsia endosymbiont of Ixodes scapularis]KDO03566.1 hypothetical protein REISMN_01155 [Rickettsia tamurae subsp. buchneri]